MIETQSRWVELRMGRDNGSIMDELRADLHQYGHPDVIIPVDAKWRQLANWLPDYFSEQVKNGVRFAPDETIQLGWALLKLAANSEGNLSVLEPNFESFPICWIEGVSRSVRFLALQRGVCEELGTDAVFPSLGEAASAPDPFPRTSHFTMTRSEPSGSHSGWTVHEGTDAELGLVSLYQAALYNNAIIPFLALPTGSVVIRDENELSISSVDKRINSTSNEFLNQILHSEVFGQAASMHRLDPPQA